LTLTEGHQEERVFADSGEERLEDRQGHVEVLQGITGEQYVICLELVDATAQKATVRKTATCHFHRRLRGVNASDGRSESAPQGFRSVPLGTPPVEDRELVLCDVPRNPLWQAAQCDLSEEPSLFPSTMRRPVPPEASVPVAGAVQMHCCCAAHFVERSR